MKIFGQLEDAIYNVDNQRVLMEDENIVSISSGDNHAMILKKTGELYVLGSNKRLKWKKKSIKITQKIY